MSRYKVDRKRGTSHGTQGLKTNTGAVEVPAITNLSWVQERFAKTVTNLLILLSVLAEGVILIMVAEDSMSIRVFK